METFGGLINGVLGHLYSFGRQRDKVTTLTAGVDSVATALQVADGALVDVGLLEIDQELMMVRSAELGGTVTLHPWGRGQEGSVAVPHNAGAKVAISPRFPRKSVGDAIKRTVASLYPDLYQVGDDEALIPVAGHYTYPLPLEFGSVIEATTRSALGEPVRITSYRVDQAADQSIYPTGKTISFQEWLPPGRPVHLTYRAAFGEFAAESDTLVDIGLRDRWADLIIYGAAGTMMLAMESLRLQADALETQERAGAVQPGQATGVARQMLGMFKQRVGEERAALNREHPARLVYQGRASGLYGF